MKWISPDEVLELELSYRWEPDRPQVAMSDDVSAFIPGSYHSLRTGNGFLGNDRITMGVFQWENPSPQMSAQAVLKEVERGVLEKPTVKIIEPVIGTQNQAFFAYQDKRGFRTIYQSYLLFITEKSHYMVEFSGYANDLKPLIIESLAILKSATINDRSTM